DPAGRAGVVAVIWLKLVTTTFVAARPPIVTVAPSSKSVPAIVTGVPVPAGPDTGVIEKGRRCENSEVLPSGSVAVALMRSPGPSVPATVMSNGPSPDASVDTWPEPR